MKQITLRLPDDEHARLKALAEREHRSLHAQILHMLNRSRDDHAPVEGERRSAQGA
ncbi:Arc family DNA-binding protein [Streptomyces sp. NPDC056716]|uniref:Arc family DNA-binding protein n=1 Tax=unclassified Streptomyces TaxID=2593676 RepID=UPI0036C54BE8